MPLSTSLPAQPIEFASDLLYPTCGQDQTQGASSNPANVATSSPGNTQTPVNAVAGVGGVLGAGGVFDLFEFGGRTCVRASTTVNLQSQGFRPIVWQAGYDAAEYNPGAFYEPESVVASIDFHVAATSALFAGGADVTGFWFQPRHDIFTQPSMAAAAPGGASALGGFGVGLNDDGGGNAQWEYIAYDGVPNILQRTAIGSAIIPDVTEWTTFRFTIIAAASGRAATVSLAVNGVDVVGVQDIPFDDVTLFRPNTLEANALQWYFGEALGPMAGDGFFFAIYARFGRFTTTGAELQSV